MSQAATAIQIGSQVRVTRVRDRIPTALVNLLRGNAVGKVVDFKMTDGQGIGIVVELSDGTTSWFFDDEVVPA